MNKNAKKYINERERSTKEQKEDERNNNRN